jgi:hypothetical protein
MRDRETSAQGRKEKHVHSGKTWEYGNSAVLKEGWKSHLPTQNLEDHRLREHLKGPNNSFEHRMFHDFRIWCSEKDEVCDEYGMVLRKRGMCGSSELELVEAWRDGAQIGTKVHIWMHAWVWMGHQFGVHSSMTAAFNDHGYLRELSRP